MRKLSVLLAVVVCFALSSCDLVFHESVKGNGELKRVSKNIAKADRIKVSDGIDVVIRKGSAGVELEADENLLKYIVVRYEDGWLTIRTRDDYQLRSENPIIAYVSTETLRGLQVSGSSNITSDEDWSTGGTFKIAVSGSGDVSLNLMAADIDADISGSGNIDLAGEAENLNVDISGSGNLKAFGLKCAKVDIGVAGSGEAEVTAEDKLKVSVAGSGDIRYKGNATVTRSIAGSGSVEKVD